MSDSKNVDDIADDVKALEQQASQMVPTSLLLLNKFILISI